MTKVRAEAVKPVVRDTPDQSAGTELRLGLQLRHARLVKGLRLRDVAEQSGYSESLISKIENNKATPSLNTLHRIAKVLGKTIATLIGDAAPAHHGVVTKSGKRPIIPQISVAGISSDGTEAELMVPLGNSALMGAFLVRVQPGGSSDGLRHHEGEEVGFMLTGGIASDGRWRDLSLEQRRFVPLRIEPAARLLESGRRAHRDHLGEHARIALDVRASFLVLRRLPGDEALAGFRWSIPNHGKPRDARSEQVNQALELQ